MEKFGIFELLDTLSAFVSAKEEQSSPQDNARTNEPPSEEKPAASPPPARTPSGAFASLLARQEEISKRIDGKK